jgi:hypothetical protein
VSACLQIVGGGYTVYVPQDPAANTVYTNSSQAAISYALPVLESLLGCASPNATHAVIGCARTGGDLVTLMGSQFGTVGMRVLIGGDSCPQDPNFQSGESMVRCKLKTGTTLSNQIIILQDTGGMSIFDAFSVSYTQCTPGTFENPSQVLQCISCPQGTYSALSSAKSCDKCIAGQVAPTSGLSACTACASGKFLAFGNLTACTDCATGRFSATPGSATCISCGLGKYASQPGQSVCLDCPRGTYRTSVSSCSSCDPGKFGAVAGLESCPVCPAQTFSGQQGQTSCEQCPFFSQAKEGQDACSCQEKYYMYSSSTQSGFSNATSAPQRTLTCLPCPTGALCVGSGDKLRTRPNLQSKPGFWRYVNPLLPTSQALALPPLMYVVQRWPCLCSVSTPLLARSFFFFFVDCVVL